MQPAFTRSPHLVGLIAQAERLAAGLADVDPASAAPLTDRAAVASVALDGSPIEGTPDPDLLADDLDPLGLLGAVASADVEPPAAAAGQAREGTWLDAMGVLHDADPRVIALEWRGVREALSADELAPRLLEDPVPALAELHGRVTRGLVAAEDAGRARRSELAVQDRSVGRILFFPADPAAVPSRLADLAGWLVGAGAREHALVTSGVAHLELLAIHPFESANGRVARTAARLLLRGAGLDPAGVGLAEEALRVDALGYLEEVARTQRRRDVTVWLERWAEAVVDGLRAATRELGRPVGTPPTRAHDFLATAASAFTIADYRAAVGVSSQIGATDLEALMDAGLVRLQPGTRGLRFLRR